MDEIRRDKIMQKLDNEKRHQMLPPIETLKKFGLKKDMNAADIGCGVGYFTIPISKIVGESSKVYGIDTSDEMLFILDDRINKENISNIYIVKADGYDYKIESKSQDFVLISNVLHEVDNKDKLVSEAYRMLLNKGIIAIVEWQKVNIKPGPPIEERISYDEIFKILTLNGFKDIIKFDINESLYGITALKI